jgi:hypothetical protein
MSWKCLEWAEDHSQSKGAAAHVLHVLARACNDDGRCWFAIPTLASKTRLTDRGVQKALQELERTGELTIQRGAAPGGASYFDMVGVNVVHPVQGEGVNMVHPNASEGVNDVHHVRSRGVNYVPARVNVVPQGVNVVRPGGEPRSPIYTTKITTKTNTKNHPPPARADDEKNGGGGGDILQSDLELEALLEELTSITGLTPTNHERAVLAVTDYGEHRRAALRELRKAWPGVTHVGGWLNRVIERIKDESERANRPLFPIEARKERWKGYEQPAWDPDGDVYH